MYGLQVAYGLNKKPTKVLVNSKYIAKRLRKTCDKRHFHASTMKGRPRMAQQYLKELCVEIIKGLEDQVKADQGQWNFMEEDEAMEEDGEEVDVGGNQEDDHLRGEKEGQVQVNEEDKKMVNKLHEGLGHPALPEFVRFMKAA